MLRHRTSRGLLSARILKHPALVRDMNAIPPLPSNGNNFAYFNTCEWIQKHSALLAVTQPTYPYNSHGLQETVYLASTYPIFP